MKPKKFRDIPSIQSSVRQARNLAAIAGTIRVLLPLLKILGIKVDHLQRFVANANSLRAQTEELNILPDVFNSLFEERGWVLYELMDLATAKRAIELARTGDFDSAEAHLVAYYSSDEVHRQLHAMNAVAAFRPRMRLAIKAAEDYNSGRFHASVPVVLALLDGLVSELHESQRGFFASEVNLTAWDSISARERGLEALATMYQSTRRRTTTEPITKPFRHGIVHGRDLAYDNRLVAAKAWAALFTIRDWALRAERGELNAPASGSGESLSTLLRQLKGNQDQRRMLNEWRPRDIKIGIDVPPQGQPEAYEPGTPERRIVEFLVLWQRCNYGKLSQIVGTEPTGRRIQAGEVRQALQGRQLESFRLASIADKAAAVSEIGVDLTIHTNRGKQEASQTYRLVFMDASGQTLIRSDAKGAWIIVNWDF
jgi:hypothetical protein